MANGDNEMNLNSADLLQFMSHFPNLKILNFREWTSIADEELKMFFTIRNPIEELRLRGCERITLFAATQVAWNVYRTLQVFCCEVVGWAS